MHILQPHTIVSYKTDANWCCWDWPCIGANDEPDDDDDDDDDDDGQLCREQSPMRAAKPLSTHNRTNKYPDQTHCLPLLFSSASPLIEENLKVCVVS